MNNNTPSVGFRWSELDEYRMDIAKFNAKAFMRGYGKGTELRRRKYKATKTNTPKIMESTPTYTATPRTNSEIIEDLEYTLSVVIKHLKALADDPELTDFGVSPKLTQAAGEIEQSRVTMIAAIDAYTTAKYTDADDLV